MGIAQLSETEKRNGAGAAMLAVVIIHKAPRTTRICSPGSGLFGANQESLVRLGERAGCNFPLAPLALPASASQLRRFSMSYQVLARKWRPRSFREMVGQTHVLKALINALDSQRL
ncbi:MAG: DNA polymerase III subunit gamma/tau, partial [Pseudomonas sp.]|nr:DNA polymerase III subunit gamma/tau [Pseudomonas sp.]